MADRTASDPSSEYKPLKPLKPIRGTRDRWLSWHGPTKQWYRSTPAGRKYFGSGKSEQDTNSYTAAVARLREWDEQRRREHREAFDQDQADRQLLKLARSYADRVAEKLGETITRKLTENTSPDASLLDLMEHWTSTGKTPETIDPTAEDPETSHGTPNPHLKQVQQVIKATKYDAEQVSKAAEPAQKTIARHTEAWLDAEKLRADAGQLSQTAANTKRRGIKTFAEFVAGKAFGTPDDLAALLAGYRAMLVGKLGQGPGKYTAHTINDKLKFAGQFIDWCYQSHVIDELPRNLKQFRRSLPVQKGGQPLKPEQIQKLWAQATPMQRTYIALALNCGFKNTDLSELRGENLQDGRLIGFRHKTAAPMNYKLWPVTQQLIAQNRGSTGQAERVLLSQNRTPLVAEGRDLVGKTFRSLAKKAGVDCTFQQLRDTGSQLIEEAGRRSQRYNPTITSLYLAHKDDATKRYYLANDPTTMETAELDAATDGLLAALGIQ